MKFCILIKYKPWQVQYSLLLIPYKYTDEQIQKGCNHTPNPFGYQDARLETNILIVLLWIRVLPLTNLSYTSLKSPMDTHLLTVSTSYKPDTIFMPFKNYSHIEEVVCESL